MPASAHLTSPRCAFSTAAGVATPPHSRPTPARAPRLPALHTDNYSNGGQDWGLLPGNALCTATASSQQSPINVVNPTYTSSLAPLNVAYGSSSTWTLEDTGARARGVT